MIGLGIGVSWNTSRRKASPNQVIINTFKARVLADGGTFEAESCLLTFLNEIN